MDQILNSRVYKIAGAAAGTRLGADAALVLGQDQQAHWKRSVANPE